MKRLLALCAAVSVLFIGALTEMPVFDSKEYPGAAVSSVQPLYSVTNPVPPQRYRRVSAARADSVAAQSVSVLAPAASRSAPLPTPVLGPVSGSLDAASRAAAWANLEVGDGTEPFRPEFAAAVPEGSRWIWRARVGYGRGDLTVTVRLDSLGNPHIELFRWMSIDQL